MKIGIIGLGLIGGSLAKGIDKYTDHQIYGDDIDEDVIVGALKSKLILSRLDKETLSICDLIIVSLYPKATVDYVKSNVGNFKDGAIVIDVAGVKEYVCHHLFEIAAKSNFTFIGTHPMAGIEFSGFEYANGDLFQGASLIVIPDENEKAEPIETVEKLFLEVGFGHIQKSTAEEHDSIIANTSQLAHIVSSAYVKSNRSQKYRGFSAGSFHDMTRVAKLNENMWSELFFLNKKNLTDEIDNLIQHLNDYNDALKENDSLKMTSLLKEGRIIKENLK